MLIILAVALMFVIGAIGFIGLDRHDEEYWRNPELFLPNLSPLTPGGRAVARYRCRPRTRGGAVGASIDAELRRVGRGPDDEPTVIDTVPLGIVDYSTPDLLEVDVLIDAPVAQPDRAGDVSTWLVVVTVHAADGTNFEATRPVTLGGFET